MRHKILFVIIVSFMLLPDSKVKAHDFCINTISECSLNAHHDSDFPMWDLFGMKDVMVRGTQVTNIQSVYSCRQCSVDGCWILKALKDKYSRSCCHRFFERILRSYNYVYFLDNLRL